MDLSDRTILLTGAAQGLGLGIGRRLARAGAHIVLVDCDPVVKDHLADPVFAGSAYLGVRTSEAVGIAWDHLDLSHRRVAGRPAANSDGKSLRIN